MKGFIGNRFRLAAALAMVVAAMVSPRARSQGSVQFMPSINTIAGTGTNCASPYACGDGGPAISAQVSTGMRQIAADAQGNVYITDTANNVIRRIDGRTGIITLAAGTYGGLCTGTTKPSCGDGGAATSGTLNGPRGVTVDAEGNLYIADYGIHRVRMVSASTGIITTIAGTGPTCPTPASNTCGDGGQAAAATLDSPSAVALDGQGNLYIADEFDYKIRKVVLSTGIISTVAGNGTKGYAGDGGQASASTAEIGAVTGLACDSAGNIYISDNSNYRIRMVQVSTGILSTIAGTGTQGTTVSSNGDGAAASAALINGAYNLAVDHKGNVYVIDNGYPEVREILATTAGSAPVFGNIVAMVGGAGSGSVLGDGGLPTAAKLSGATGLTIDPFGNLIVGDTYNARVRRVNAAPPFASTAVGSTSATITFTTQDQAAGGGDGITGFAMAPGFTEFTPMTYAALQAEDSGACTGYHSAQVCQETATASPKYPGLRTGILSLTDYRLSPVSLGLSVYGLAPSIAFSPGLISTVSGSGTAGYTGDGGAAATATLSSASSAVMDEAGNLYIADTGNHVIREVTWATGTVSVIAGTAGSSGYSGDGAAATSATFSSPAGVSVDVLGNLYVADTGNHVIRKVNLATGIITTVAGNHIAGNTGDGEAATAAELNAPAGVFYLPPPAVQSSSMTAAQMAGQLFIADTGNHAVRAVNLATGILTTVAGTGSSGYSGDGAAATAATLNAPAAVAADVAGNLYIADTGNHVIREVSRAAGTISTVAGSMTSGYSGDGGSATSAALTAPSGIALDSAADLIISDPAASTVRMVNVVSGVTVDFGAQGVFASSPEQTVTVTNTGNETLALSGLSLTGNYPQATTGGNDCGPSTTLDSGASCTITLSFEPLTVGSFPGQITITDNALNATVATQTIQITGSGTPSMNAILTGTAGNSQTAVISTAYQIALQVSLTDANCAPLSGQSITFTAPAGGAGATFPGGLSTVTVTTDANGIATAPALTANGTLGAFTVTASFPSAASPVVFNLTNVANLYATTTAISITPSGSSQVYGQAITLTGAISPATNNGIAVSGSIVFSDGTTTLGSATIANGSASLAIPAAAVGAHSYQATYTGDLNFASSASTAQPLTVAQASVSVTPSSLSFYYGQSTASITVAGQFTGTGIAQPTGSITYSINNGASSPATLSGGTAQLTIPSSLAPGTYSIVVNYSGDTNYAAGSSTIALTIQQPSFQLASSAQSLTVAQGGYSSAATLTITPIGNLSGNVVFSCSGLPLYTACVFNVPSGNPANALIFIGSTTPQTVQLSVAAQEAVGSLNRNGRRPGEAVPIAFAGMIPVVFAFCFGRSRRIRRSLRLFLLAGLCAASFGAMGVIGCGSSHVVAPKATPGTTTITVTATDSTSQATQSLSMSVTVQPAS